ncbi:MAG: hypothetical protein IJ506_01975 [Clostridia bacterium]|nr:hypothetical protein [Clostridia bacterium]
MKKAKSYPYILRYYLPTTPLYDEEYTEKRFTELLEFCKEAKVEAVMFFVALAPYCYYWPEDPSLTDVWVERMEPYVERLKAEGISYQLNFQNTLGAIPTGVGMEKHFDWEHLVDINGGESNCGCPIGKKFRENTGKRLQYWARTKPDVIWFDDDFRMHGHNYGDLTKIIGSSFYCYCDEHIRLFNEKYNTNYTRESLVEEILKEGEPTWARNAYLRFIGDTMAETAEWMGDVIHKESPKTRVALMTSMPDVHATEWRDWKRTLDGFEPNYKPLLRSHFGVYCENDPREAMYSYPRYEQLKAQLKKAYGGEIDYCPEIENTPFTVWSKSGNMTAYQIALSAFMGSQGITLSLYDLNGGAFFEEPTYREVLKKEKPFVNKLFNLDLRGAKSLGVMIPTDPESGLRYRTKSGEGFSQLRGEGRYIHEYLLKIGIPCCYRTPEELEGGVVVLDRYTANFLSDEELKKVLSGSAFIDYGAAQVLIERGFSSYIGISGFEGNNQKIIQSEVFTKRKREDGTYICVPCRVPNGKWSKANLLDGAEVLSQFVPADGEKVPGLVWFDNPYGGKVLTFIAKDDWSRAFYAHQRVAYFKELFHKLCPTLPRLDCHSYTMLVASEKDGETYYLITNLATDTGRKYVLNGQDLSDNLSVYQTVVYVEKNGELKRIGKTKKY